jgi:hypothetical protein
MLTILNYYLIPLKMVNYYLQSKILDARTTHCGFLVQLFRTGHQKLSNERIDVGN